MEWRFTRAFDTRCESEMDDAIICEKSDSVMSGGRLVVLDRAGRDVKRYPLAEGLATLGSDPACDIRIMLSTVSPHHATVVVHTNQTVIRNVCADETLVNGRPVSVAALRHGDVISIGGRHLRWEYSEPGAARPQAPEPALYVPVRRLRGARRASGPAREVPARARGDPQLRLQLELAHRASMPGNAGGKQVAIVQPQRRDTSDLLDKNPPRTPQQANKRARTSKSELDTSVSESEPVQSARKSRVSPAAPPPLQSTTKATLWIESRKSSPRKSKHSPAHDAVLRARRNTGPARKTTPLRLTVLKRAQSAQKPRVTKIEGPLKIDHTKQAAIRLMTGHTPKSKSSSPSFVVKKPSPVRRTPRARNSRATPANTPRTPANTRASAATPSDTRTTLSDSRSTVATPGDTRATPGNTSSRRSGANRTVTILEITDSDGRNSSVRTSTTSRRSSPKKSLGSTSPRKSSLKDPSAKRGSRKTESIKFDLSNLESQLQDSDAMTSRSDSWAWGGGDASESDVALHYSPSPPSARRALHSRAARLLQSSLGAALPASPAPPASPARRSAPPTPPTPPSARSGRGSRSSLLVQSALRGASTSYERRATKSLTERTRNTPTPDTRHTASPSRNALESYSIVDLVSIDTDESARSPSVYNSADSTASTTFGTPQTASGRKTRSTIEPTLLGSSTPYVKGRPSTTRSRSSSNLQNLSKTSVNDTQSTIRNSKSRRSKSVSTPENTEDVKKHISVNSTRISRASRSRSRLNDSELLLLDDDDDSPRTSKRVSTASKSARFSARTANDTELTPTHSPAQENGTCTPENTHSPEEASTPVLSIQSLLDYSQSSLASRKPTKKGRPSFNTKRKTIGGASGPKTRVSATSKSLSFSARKTRLRLSSESVEALNKNDDGEIVTPKSAVKLVPEGVKNKHSTAKKPQSKRSIIDDLNESDIVKQLFSSPVKRKLSQSMTEFSRRQLLDDDAPPGKRRARHTLAAARTPDASLLDHTDSYTPEMFVSPISTPTRSPSLDGVKRMFAKTTPENDLRNVRGVKALLRTPRPRRSIKNDLTNVSGVKNIFAKSPKNRLSDVRVKAVFVPSPRNDLRRVTGVKSLFQGAKARKSPRNELDDVRGVKQLFNAKSPANDLRNVSGVKRTLRRQSPNNDLTDVRGVKRVFRRDKRNDLSDVSGVEELFNVSNYSSANTSTRAESLFDQLVGKPQIRAVYSKTLTTKKTVQKTKGPRATSLHASLDQITASDNNWLEQELNKRLQIKNYLDSLKSTSASRANRSKSNKSKSLHASLDEVTDVDVLLDEELNKEQQINKYLESMRSVNESKANKSTSKQSGLNKSKTPRASKANVSRELQKLVTDTVEGGAPLQRSRIRSSTIIQSNESESERKKSTSELYGAHTLPIKKRSLADRSHDKAQLPLKKRLVVHSTPVKGRAHAALNASALSRVSPIRAHDDTAALHDASLMSTQPKQNKEVRAKSTRGTRGNTELETSASRSVNVSAKKARGRSQAASPKATPTSPAKEKAEQAKKASPVQVKEASLVRTRNSSLAKARTASPAKAQKTSPAKAQKASPAKLQKTSPAKAQKTSPAKTQKASPAKAQASPAKVQNLSPAKAQKPSPLKTRKASPAKAQKASPAKTQQASPAKVLKTRSTRAQKASPVKAQKPSPVKTRKASPAKAKKAASAVAKKASPVKAKKSIPAKSKAVSPVKKASPVKTSAAKKPVSAAASPVLVKATRSRRNNASTLEPNTKKRRASLVISKKSPIMSPKPRATRKRKEPETTSTPAQSPKKGRATRKITSVKDDKPKTPKSSRAKLQRATVVVVKPSPQLKPRATRRGRADLNHSDEKETTIKSRKTVTVQETKLESPRKSQARGRASKAQAAAVQPTTRGRRTAVSESKDTTEVEKPQPKTTRGRKTDEPAAKKAKNDKEEKPAEAKPVRSRGKKVESGESVEPPPSTRARRGATADSIAPTVPKTRKRKSDSEPENELPPKVRKSKQVADTTSKRAPPASAGSKNTRNKPAAKETKKESTVSPVKTTRAKKTAAAEPANTTKQAEQKTRGKKANVEYVPANQSSGKRKRAAVDASPVKERKTRATRGNIQLEGKPSGRSRRR
ncbi:hypothetical protein PYW07_009827 [Mythimna separata]|uniref:FHA domain-containing protein n=1 Tax=Mythimna separata TaxID=271217 RepID=A0AAD7YGC8_MYTSE|nr:hypothetical protein PYW07_009827 [Mythimna separata]